MPSLRTSNRYLVAKSSGQISDQVKVRVYDSSVFEGVHLKKNHALVALAKASRKKAAKQTLSMNTLRALCELCG